MRTARTLSLSLALSLAIAGSASADRRHAVYAARDLHLRARPGETASVVGRADQGEQLTVEAQRGRWLRVRHGERSGWVARTEVDDAKKTAEPAPRKRAEKSGFSGAPHADTLKVKVTIDRVRGFDDPETKAHTVLDLARGDEVTVIGRGHDGWLLVEEPTGNVGWIPSVTVDDAGRFAADPRSAPEEQKDASRVNVASAASAAPEEQGGAMASMPAASTPSTKASMAAPSRGGHTIEGMLAATAGAQLFAMRQTGGSEALATAKGPAIAMAAAGRMRVTGDLFVGVGADASLGSGSLVYQTADTASDPMNTKTTSIDAHAEVAWGPSWQVAARAGYHYSSLTIGADATASAPMLIGEKVAGPLVGLGGAIPVGDRFALVASLDVMPVGTQRPDQLPPGILYAKSIRAAWARATMTIRLPAHLLGALSYRGGVAEVDLTDGQATPTTARRNDQDHTFSAGVGLSW